jgi:DNA-binding NarL/FixJ family response regulator
MVKSLYDAVLLIDEMPLMAAGLQEVLQVIHPSVKVEHADNVFHVLSSPAYENRSFGLIILGSGDDHSSGSLLLPAAELKEKFPGSQIMIFTDQYDPALIDTLGQGTIAACVHKHEMTQEIHKAWAQLKAGGTYLSPILYSLYSIYRLNR